jgi:DNA-binding CsgD family transcriptional regulator
VPESGEIAELRAALLWLRRASGLPLAFGGLLTGPRQFRISEQSGNNTLSMQGLAITSGNGIGGKAVALARPIALTDYSTSRVISHEYDAAAAGEGVRAVLAVPVVVHHRVRGVLYGGLRDSLPLGDRTLTAAVGAAQELGQRLAVRDEANRLLAAYQQPTAADPAAWEEVREAHTELRALAARVADPLLQQEILAACGRLATASSGGAKGRPVNKMVPPTTTPSPREVDVLACVATGATNAVAGERLGLRPETVKSYLRSAMRKLGARTRLEAVVAARRAGLLP